MIVPIEGHVSDAFPLQAVVGSLAKASDSQSQGDASVGLLRPHDLKGTAYEFLGSVG